MGRRTGIGLGVAALALTAGVAARPPDISAERKRLAEAKRDAAAAAAHAEALRRSADEALGAAARAAAEERALAARVAAAEAELEAARARLAVADRMLGAQRERLGAVQAPAARLLAALQSLAGRPAIAALAQPGSVDDLVHLRAILATALPALEARARTVREDVARTHALRREAALAAAALLDGRGRLEAERVAQARAAARQRAMAGELERGALSESDRALALGERAREIVDRMTAEQLALATGEELGDLPGPMPRPVAQVPSRPAKRDAYRLPVSGRLVTGFGALSPDGVRSRGLSFAVEPGSSVVAPAGGMVRYARPYRGFGTVVIIDHGEGWTTTLTGLGTARVRPGAAVADGAPVGIAPAGEEAEVTVELRRRGRPVDIVALL